ncbi:hypothetical protein [Plantactinospora endophytica]|uniref:Gram-positive cocci surface proteins LPxTG domain-containing protein n=1 Tax=Plantactinospora endophytica TaxID=673535 RepID=A0ABQ4E686_9ACTN|nr:hypothetical protein [Plantactinospora endophytica]GIG90184.1 hypothetical protein Pen02_51200 [Plantactinospora endophytica]
MTDQDRTGRPGVPPRPRRAVVAGLALSAGLAVTGTTVAAASWPDHRTRTAVAAAAPEPAAPGTVTFRVVPAPTTPPPTPSPTAPTRPPTPWPTPSGHLPVTGGGDPVPNWLPALGALLVLTGGLIVALARRSRRPDEAGPTP